MEIAGRIAVITGGGSGLGAATAESLAAQGAKVAILDIVEDAGRAQAERIGGLFFRTDVTSEGEVGEALERVNGEVIRLDGAIRMAPR
ncbi:MAG TPA: SDR family NAD(P)-dependent oxidoreductase [Sphingomonas sp.]|nr:SDR family NAD(P)-dependent oxidoreductase [Sphingomonas sp.]